MSRICVKNLPKDVSEDRLRQEFSKKGEITDVKLMRTKDGRNRQFAFIGFRTDHEAQEAIRYFNRTYFQTSRVTCEVAKKVGDTNLPRPWSRHSKKKNDEGNTIDAKKHARAKGQGDKSKDIVDIDDPQLEDFLQVMQPRNKSKLWANDDTSIACNVSNNRGISNKNKKATSHANANANAIHPILVPSGSLINNHKENKSCEVEHGEVISDMGYFKSRVTKEWRDSESSDDDDNENDSMCIDEKDNHSHDSKHEEKCNYNPFKGTSPRKNHAQELDIKGQEDTCGKGVLESCRLFVRNLPYTTTEEELQQHVCSELLPASEYGGGALEVHLVVDKHTKRSKGIAYILFSGPEFAARALEKLDHSTLQGRLLHVMPAIQRPSNNEGNNVLKVQESKTLKQRRVEERKAAEASGDTRAWNSLFIRQDTVVENIARRYSTSKSDLLDRPADDLAVCITLGEAQVISETKKALTNSGVNVESLEELANNKVGGLKRSNHVILVKNLPYVSTENELAKMFGKFGSLDKIILPPTKALALVVFLEPAEAKAAFRGLTYKRYKDAPLYLEWAPSNILSQSSASKNNEMNSVIGENDAKRLRLEQDVERISDVDIDPDRTRSLHVKNLNFKTNDESLRKHFSEQMKEGTILSVKVQKHLKKEKNVSSGYGFIEFDSTETAANVCRDLQGTVLDGHALILQLSHAKHEGHVQKRVDKDKSSTKLLVRNVAFEATEDSLRKLFSSLGMIKSLRLPKRTGFRGHRGFGFVEYVTPQEAQDALTTLSSSHHCGRKLVIERAKVSESLDELRARTCAQFSKHNGFQNATMLSKKRKHTSISKENEV